MRYLLGNGSTIRRGIHITLEGQEYSNEEIAANCLSFERGRCLGNYIVEDERLVELRFERVENNDSDKGSM